MTNPSRDGSAAMVRGALVLIAIGGTGALLLLRVGVVSGSTKYVGAGLALIAFLLASGGTGGLLYHVSARLRDRGWFGLAASWCLSAWAALLTLMLLVHEFLPALGLGGLDATRAAELTGRPAVVYLALASLLFGMIMAEAAVSDARAPLFILPSDTVRRGTIIAWATMILVACAAVTLLDRDSRLPLPESEADARRLLADAEFEARLRPRDARTQLVLGLSLMQLRRFQDAQPALERAERLDPDNSHPRNALGWTLNQQRRFAEAVPHLQEAVRISPDYGEAHHNLGWALLNLDRLPEAELAYRETVRLKPKDAGAASEYGRVLYRRDKTGLAIAQLVRATKLSPSNPGYHAIASFLLRSQGRFPEATAHLGHALRLAPERAELWAQLGVLQYLMNDAPAAAAAFAEAARRDSAYFVHRPQELAMWRAAQRGRTGELEAGEADVSPQRTDSTREER